VGLGLGAPGGPTAANDRVLLNEGHPVWRHGVSEAEPPTPGAPPAYPGCGATFGQWFLSGADSVDSGFWTLERIGVGSTVADMRRAYSDGFSIVQAVETDPAGLFDLDAVGLDGGISGATSNTTDSGRVLQLWAGEACFRLFGRS
jgi:hypothetical protein